jgi:choline dehydrogenase-like flavoprotein
MSALYRPPPERSPLPEGVVDARHHRGDRREQVDVLVVGSGCGGATAAASLAEKGHSVLMVEKGRYRTSAEFTVRELDMYARLYADRGMTGPEDASSAILYGEVVGGSSIHYMANSFRAPAFKLKMWAEALGIEGMGEADLSPYYDVVEERHGVHPAHEWEINRNNQLFKEGCEKLGWKSGPMPHARKQCALLGYCMLGCPMDRKQSQLLTHIPLALSHGARLFAETRLESIRVEGGRAIGAECALLGEDGKVAGRLVVDAKVVLLAGGGVGTPMMLLRQGLANGSGMVGKNFFVTPHLFTIGEFDEQVDAWYGMPAGWHCEEWEKVRGDEGGYMIQGIFAQPAMISQLTPGFGEFHRDMMTKLPRLGALLSLIDDEEPGQVSLGKGGRTKIDYHLRGRDIPKARDFFKKSAMILLAAGAKRVLVPDIRRTEIRDEGELSKIDSVDFTPGHVPFVGTSNLGTCRMGPDPKTSVVDSRCESHDVKGLYLVDASVLPTTFCVDPSLTIMANALRVTDRLAADL